MVSHHIGAIGARHAGIEECDGGRLPKDMDGNEVQTHGVVLPLLVPEQFDR